MRNAKRFLKLLSEEIEPGKGRSHSLIINDEGELVLQLICNEKVISFILYDPGINSIEDNVNEEVQEIVNLILEELQELEKHV